MSLPHFNPRFTVLLLFIVFIAVLRLASFYEIGPLTFFSPIGAMALFGGAYLKGKLQPFLFPLLTLLISDIIISFTLFDQFRTGLLYAGWYWTYLAFALMTLAGRWIIRDISVVNIGIAVITATVLHWLVANVGMCVQENQFTLALYGQKLSSSIAYELKFLSGTALFSAVMFGGFELLQRKYASIRLA